MSSYFITRANFEKFIVKLIQAKKKIYAPVSKKQSFIFDELTSFDDLRLDYDVTILPPKKYIFPPRQGLLTFDKQGHNSLIAPEDKILLGVHFYDLKAIDMLDNLFAANNSDANYLANRAATTIIGANIQKISKRAFWGSVGKDVRPHGYDGFIIKLDGGEGYVYECYTDKGSALLKSGDFSNASPAQIAASMDINERVLKQCPEKLNHSSKEIATKVRSTFKEKQLWEELADDCFSCGSCNTVCPTCYCFDVQDNWNVDQVSGRRERTWDACMTEDFAKIS
ncbi:MAG: hypothetical protein A2451_16185, partial [Bdellovibrionales bacterium RIFOXYC2_FULL_39_8]